MTEVLAEGLASFTTVCNHCTEFLFVTFRDRAGKKCPHCQQFNGPWPLTPSLDDLPNETQPAEYLNVFSDKFNPLPYFRRTWGEDYGENIGEIWRACVESFRENGAPPLCSLEEFLLCLQYDRVLGPALGVPEPDKTPFHYWLVKRIENRIRENH